MIKRPESVKGGRYIGQEHFTGVNVDGGSPVTCEMSRTYRPTGVNSAWQPSLTDMRDWSSMMTSTCDRVVPCTFAVLYGFMSTVPYRDSLLIDSSTHAFLEVTPHRDANLSPSVQSPF